MSETFTDIPPEELPAFLENRALLGDRDYRLDHIYRIRDEEGKDIRFVRNEVQRSFDKNMWYRNVIPKARKLGFSTYIGIFILDECYINGGVVCGITDQTMTDAEDKLSIIRFAYDRMPEDIKKEFQLVRSNDRYLEWANGSSVSVGLSYRGGTPRILHCSEYGKVSVERPNLAHEVKTGAIQAVPQKGIVVVESTAHGNAGDFCDMVRSAEKKRVGGQQLTPLDFRSHFYGWMHKREYRLDPNLVLITQEMKEYFAELEFKHGIALEAAQKAWYQKKFEELGPDDIKQEFPSIPEELFFASLQGAYWRREMTKARQEKRVGFAVPHDPTRRVNTMWDIGEDATAIIFHQGDGVRHRLIDYFEEEGGSLQSACTAVDRIARDRKFIIGEHYFPHDIEEREWGNKAVSRKKTAEELLGKKIIVVPRIMYKEDSIEAARRMLGMTYIDHEHCSRLVDAFDNYRKKWNDRMGVFMAEPVHDWASHPADAFQQGAMGIEPERLRERRTGARDEKKGSSWAA